ncbi:MAG: rhodanese-like domain-containing protein [Pseudomonadota bacterium]
MRTVLLAGFAALALTGSAIAAEWKKLMEPVDLAAVADDAVILDIRSGKDFARGSIAGALNAPYPSWRGPKENPGQPMEASRLTERMQSLGLDRADKVVVVYHGKNATDFGAAARVYWTLKSAGLTELAILNGGLVNWVNAGNDLSTEAGVAERSTETFALSGDWMMSRAEVLDVVEGRADAQIIDARPLPFLKGKKKHPAAKAAGTLRNAAQVTHSTWFKGDNNRQMSLSEEVAALATKAGVEDGASRPIASFCNTGHWAATNWFALSEIAGIDNVKLYPESMVGWTKAGGAVETRK